MKVSTIISLLYIFLLFTSLTFAEPGFNGNAPGCAGSGCHTSQSGIVTAEVLDNLQVRITVTGTSSKVAGELVNSDGNVVAVNNSTNSNPFILTAPSAGTYTVNAGYKNPSRSYGSTTTDITLTSVQESLIGLNPNIFQLYSNYPNPFNPSTTILYQIPIESFVSLKIYNSIGEQIAILVDEVKTEGLHEVNFDASQLPSGVYFYQITAGSFKQVKKMLLLK